MHMHRPASDLDGFFDSLHRDYGDIAYHAVGGKVRAQPSLRS